MDFRDPMYGLLKKLGLGFSHEIMMERTDREKKHLIEALQNGEVRDAWIELEITVDERNSPVVFPFTRWVLPEAESDQTRQGIRDIVMAPGEGNLSQDDLAKLA